MTQLYATSYAINTSSEGNYQGDVAHSKWAGNQPIIAVNLSTIIHLTLSQLFLKKKKKLPVLKRYLKSRGITADGRKKSELLELAIRAH